MIEVQYAHCGVETFRTRGRVLKLYEGYVKVVQIGPRRLVEGKEREDGGCGSRGGCHYSSGGRQRPSYPRLAVWHSILIHDTTASHSNLYYDHDDDHGTLRRFSEDFGFMGLLGRIVVGLTTCLIGFIAYSSQIFIIWPWYGRVLSVELLTLLVPFKCVDAVYLEADQSSDRTYHLVYLLLCSCGTTTYVW